MSETHTPVIGTWAITSDGKEAGKIAEVRADYIKLSAPAMLDCWLPVEDVSEVTDKETLLSITMEEVQEKKLDKPPA